MSDDRDLRILAVSPDGRSKYDSDGYVWTEGPSVLQQGALQEAPNGYEGLKFARFLDNDTIGVSFQTGYYFGGFGSAGSPQCVVQVLVRTQSATWDVVACVRYDRTVADGFAAREIAWHQSGVLAWLGSNDLLFVSVGLEPPQPFDPYSTGADAPHEYPAGSNARLEFEYTGPWSTLRISECGTTLLAVDEQGCDTFDLKGIRLRRDDGPWEDMKDVWGLWMS